MSKMNLTTFESLEEKLEPTNLMLNQYIDQQRYDFIVEQGFDVGEQNSYSELPYHEVCYKKRLYSNNDWPIDIFITPQGMAVDLDYECGGNSHTNSWLFEDYGNDMSSGTGSFDFVWEQMMSTVKYYKS